MNAMHVVFKNCSILHKVYNNYKTYGRKYVCLLTNLLLIRKLKNIIIVGLNKLMVDEHNILLVL